MPDLPALAIFTGVLLAIVGLGEALRAWGRWSPESSRRMVHALTGVAVVVAIPYFTSPLPLYLLGGAFVAINLASVARGWFPGMHGIRRKSIGTVTFPLALVFALLTCWTLDPARTYIIQIAFAVLALSDPLASLVGTSTRRPWRFLVGDAEKSVAGSLAFFASAWMLVSLGLSLVAGPGLTAVEIVLAAFAVAALATCAEAVAARGWDNFFIVAAAVAPLVWLHQFPDTLPDLLLATALATIFAVTAHAARFLTVDGTLAAAALAFFVVGFGGWSWAMPAFAFFLLSSVLSKVGRAAKRSAETLAEKGSTRDAGQVYANGGIAWLLLLAYVFWPDAGWLYWGFVGAFAAAAADTWATEIGTMARGTTRHVWTGRRVPPGTSGGVSVPGTLGALAGAVIIWATTIPFTMPHGSISAGLIPAAVVGGGFVGAFADSLLGARLQAAYLDPDTGQPTERRAPGAEVVRGKAWVTNDMVNLAGTAVGALVPIAVLLLR